MNRKRLYIIGGIVAGLIILFLIIGLLSPKTGTLTITAPASSPINVTITNKDASFNRTFLIDAADTAQYSLRPDSYKVVSTTATLKSIDILTITADKATKLEVSFELASSATKIATGLDFCPLVIQDKVYDYDCLSDGFIYEQSGLDETKSILFDSQWFEYLIPYKNGFLGRPMEGELQYVDLTTRQMQPIALPQELTSEDARAEMKVTTSSDPTQTYFALSVSTSDSVYLFKDAADTSPKKLDLPRSDFLSRSGFMDSLTFSGNNLVVFAGPINESDKHEGETHLSAPAAPKSGAKIVEYDMSGSIVKSIDAPSGFSADRVLKLSNKYYAADRIEGVEFFYLNGNKLESIHTVSEVVASVPIGDKLYIQADNDIYLFKPGDAGSFSIKSTYTPTDNQTLNGIYGGPGYLVFSATVPGKDVANVFRLTN